MGSKISIPKIVHMTTQSLPGLSHLRMVPLTLTLGHLPISMNISLKLSTEKKKRTLKHVEALCSSNILTSWSCSLRGSSHSSHPQQNGDLPPHSSFGVSLRSQTAQTVKRWFCRGKGTLQSKERISSIMSLAN